MSVSFAQRACSTRVSRVLFGVSPNCGGARELALAHMHYPQRRPRVSGAPPETTRETRVLQLRIGSFRHA
jgi:hypothetical protein